MNLWLKQLASRPRYNHGLTASLPVIEYARELKVSQDTLYRALLISNLVTLHAKNGIGRLSAYCGAISAGAGIYRFLTALFCENTPYFA